MREWLANWLASDAVTSRKSETDAAVSGEKKPLRPGTVKQTTGESHDECRQEWISRFFC